ncbi:hypothetical protein PaG_05281 [Moesziomyces aphidis]|uniref:Uncharacterized protein n=1 Tax=Moesziomyces aphidis TaxID=84754 RepID=W3VGI9_MOEAP|nr:hypothetical protein PaG_05281 [Moesziomyces aphidis]
MPGATPLALGTIRSHLDHILRHFSILQVALRPDLRSDVLKIVKYLARQRGLYPTGQQKKRWIDDSTVAALEAAIWTVAAQLTPRKGPRSVASLLSIQLIVMFLDEFGSRVSSWLDNIHRPKGQAGRYLRWGMVTITFCGYSASGNDPEFVLNVSNSSSKKAGRSGDLNFTVNTLATRRDRPKSQDPVFCLVALGIIQHVFRDDVARIFSDRTYGSSLLRRNKSQYVITAKDEVDDCAVFVHGRVLSHQPDQERPNTSTALKHPSDRPAWGQHHRPMSTKHLADALGKLSRHIGLTHKVTSRTFRTTFAFKNVLQAKIPAWRLAARMGHFSGNKDLSRKTYAPTYGPVDTRRTAATVDPSAAFSDGVRESLASNGAIAPLPDADDIDPALLARARRLLGALEDHLEHQTDQRVPTAMADEIVDMFRTINTGVRIPFKDALAGLLSLTSIRSRSSHSVAQQQQQHPFDDEGIRKGTDAALLKWLEDGASRLCPSCHESLHNEKIKKKGAVPNGMPSNMFLLFNDCLKQKHAEYCCFICSQRLPLADGTDHAVRCFQQHYDVCCADGLDFDRICVLRSSSIERWKKAHFLVCPIASCIDQDWYQGPGADDRAYLYGTASIRKDKRKGGPEIGGGKLEVHNETSTFFNHLAAHFFDTALVHTSSGRAFQVRARMPETLDGTAIVCPVRNCSQRWKHDSAGDTAFLAHLINLHRFPILFDADGQAVGSIEAGQERKLTNLLPYVPDTTKAIPDVELQHPDRSFDGFYIRVRVDYLRRMAQAGHKRVLRTDKATPTS